MITLTDILQQKQEIAKVITSLQREVVFFEGKHQCLVEMEQFLVAKTDAARNGQLVTPAKVIPQVAPKNAPPIQFDKPEQTNDIPTDK